MTEVMTHSEPAPANRHPVSLPPRAVGSIGRLSLRIGRPRATRA
jgi:hypothetical protein